MQHTNLHKNVHREAPLCAYIFTAEAEVQNLFKRDIQSGGMCMNDTIMHYAGKRRLVLKQKIKK